MSAPYEVLPALTQDSPEWHEQRRNGIGASDVAAILGLSPWATPLSIYRQKMGVPNEIDENLAWFGHHLEPVIADWIIHRRTDDIGVILDGFSARSTVWPWLTAAPDRVTYRYDGNALVPVELKTSSAFSKATWDAGVPLYYEAQVQAQCAVLGAPYGWLAVLHGGNSPDLHRIERDDEFINDELVPRTKAFWEDHVLAQVPPEPVSTAEAVEIWPGEPDSEALEADDDTYQLWQDLRAARSSLKAAESTAKALDLAMQTRMRDVTELRRGKQVLVTWNPRAGARRLDTSSLKADHPDLVAAYTRQGEPGRTWSVKEPKTVEVDA